MPYTKSNVQLKLTDDDEQDLNHQILRLMDSIQHKEHAVNTAKYSVMLAKQLQSSLPFIDQTYIEYLEIAALWHDVGKAFVSKTILHNLRSA